MCTILLYANTGLGRGEVGGYCDADRTGHEGYHRDGHHVQNAVSTHMHVSGARVY